MENADIETLLQIRLVWIDSLEVISLLLQIAGVNRRWYFRLLRNLTSQFIWNASAVELFFFFALMCS